MPAAGTPTRCSSRGGIGELKTSGGLLGLFKGEEFPTLQMTLDPGDKVIFFTDGVELAFQKDDGSGLDTTSYQRFIEQEAGTPIGQLMNTIDERLNLDPGSLNPRDDITLVGFECSGVELRSGGDPAAVIAFSQPLAQSERHVAALRRFADLARDVP